MKFSLALLCAVACYVTGVQAQGFVPPFRPVQEFSTRRQLTPVQQTHILSDVQQHQHRFSFPQNQVTDPQQQKHYQKSPNVLVEPAISQQLPTQTTIIQNQRPPAQNQQQQQYQFPQTTGFAQQSQNNYRAVPRPNNLNTNEQHVQHHTQTNFIPNYTAQQEQPSSGHVQFPQQSNFERNQQFAPQPNQQSVPLYHQQPLNQRSIAGQYQQKPFVPSQQLTSTLEPLLPTPNVPAAQQFGQNFAAAEPTTLQNQRNRYEQPQILQIQPSQQINYQQQEQPQQFGNFAPQQQQQQQQQYVQQQPQQQSYQPLPSYFRDPKDEEERQKLLRNKQQIIQKHEAFVQKQYQKQQNKVKQQHQEFLEKQRRIKEQSITVNRPTNIQYTQQITRSRNVHPYESGAFQRAVKIYQETHPTPPPPPTTTVKPTTVDAGPSSVRPAKQSVRPRGKGEITDDELEHFLKNHRQKLYGELKQEVENAKTTKPTKKVKSTKALGRDDLLKQLKLALAEAPQDLSNGNSTYSSMDLVLPNGEKVQVIRTTDPQLVQGATQLNGEPEFLAQPEKLVAASSTQKPQFSYEELTKNGFLPPGSDFEVVRQSADGALQPVQEGAIPKEKKVTFVYLEEQTDGSYKVQGVKGNGDKVAKTKGTEVDNILKRIKNGEIQLPPPSNKGAAKAVIATTARPPTSYHPSSARPVSVVPLSSSTHFESSTPSYSSSPSATPSPTLNFHSSASPYSTLSTITDNTIHLTAASSTHYPSSTPSSTAYRSTFESSSPSSQSTFDSASSIFETAESSYGSSSTFAPSTTRFVETTVQQPSSPSASPSVASTTTTTTELSNILKAKGLHAMAKYLKQSGLDSILNETGPYTVFAPTDKAFKSLLVQLGGPERAEEKFKTNPRLLSGLLLHHVIPGSFEITTLQDEMTGVSLAGTQLRVNQYNMHDSEWNDVKITTINGAMIVPEKNDIQIPQGIAHAVDRVMFPLPVGDILQTLQSDREHRFTQFLRALVSSGVSEILQNKDSGSKTYTIFAPTDAAFANQTQEELTFTVTDKEAATKLVMKHITPGTLFSAGMRFYQVKDSLTGGKPITLQKTSGGKIKVNEAQILTSNIPATNGVIHAIDFLL